MMRAVLNRLSSGFRFVIGMLVMIPGVYFVFVSVHKLLSSEIETSRALITVGVGLLMMTIGGFIISDALAVKIATGVANALKPFLSYLPGGRRRTDPPADDDASVITEQDVRRLSSKGERGDIG